MKSNNQVIHEAMGLCPHSFEHADTDICEHCGEEGVENNTDYTTPEHYCRLMDWMRKGDKWDAFRCWYIFDITYFLESDRQEQVSILADAIREGTLKAKGVSYE